MNISSPVFRNNDTIPSKYTCDGNNVNPPLAFSDVPSSSQSLALIVEDPDAPSRVFTHWVLYDILPNTHSIDEHQAPPAKRGRNDFGQTEYGGPCPPSGTHRYVFRLYALDQKLGLPEGARKEQVLNSMQGHIIATAELIGRYTKHGRQE